jgi:hypothetical protein
MKLLRVICGLFGYVPVRIEFGDDLVAKAQDLEVETFQAAVEDIPYMIGKARAYREIGEAIIGRKEK